MNIYIYMRFPKMEKPQNGWFKMEKNYLNG
jgi:hypothetical protein